MFQSAVPRDFGSVIATDALAPSTLTSGTAHPLQLPNYSSSAVREVAFVDGGLSDAQTLINGIKPGTAVYVLDPTGNELNQITQVLAGYHDLAAVSIFSHGSDGALQLGKTSLNVNGLMDYTGLLQSWGSAFSETGDLLLYGCDVAADATGQSFVRQIASLTGADVAASTDRTGSSALGGNWTLEFSTGSIEATNLVNSALVQSYAGVLALSFPVTSFGTGSSPRSVATGDFNGDGKLDLAVANRDSNNVSVLLGNGDGSFGTATNFGTGNSPNSVVIGDLNGDGKPDLAVANPQSDNVSVLLGNGDGSFGTATNFGTGNSPQSVAIADLNGDGKLDLATANFNSDSVSVLLGDGTGSFGTVTNFGTGDRPQSVAIADLNGDRKLDLAVANQGSDNVSVLLGDGTGSFGAATNFGTGNRPTSVEIADLNGDGKLDLANANVTTSGSVSVLLGNGDGSFGAATNFGVGSFPQSVEIGDLNGDGKLDLATASSGSDAVSVLLGNGNGSFGAATNFGTGDNPYSVAIADFNGDGKLDLATANRNSNNVSVLLNTPNSAPVNTVPATQTTLEDTSLVFSSTNGNALSITDDSASLTTTVSVTDGTGSLSATAGGGATITNNGSSSVTLAGTVDQINAALAGLTYTPTANANGTNYTTLTLSTTDGSLTDTDTLTINVTSVNDAPALTGPAATLPAGTEDTAYTISVTNLLTGFTDVEGDPLSVSGLTATNGTLTNNNDGTYTFTPNANYNGTVNLSYTVTDGKGGSTAATQSFTLAAVNDAPALTGPAATLPAGTEDTAYTISVTDLLTGFTDVDGDTLSVSGLTATNGTLTNNNNGTYTFTPNANYNGTVNLSYTVADGKGGSTAATQSFTLAAVNDAPTIAAPPSVRVQSGGTAISGISIADVDAGTGTLTTTLSVTNGTLNLTNLNGATATGVNTGTVTLTGTLTQLNAALATLRYSGSTFSGNTNLTVTVNDNGNVGSGGAKTATQTIALQVARDLGNLGRKEIEVKGTVSSSDPVDRYQFTLTQATTKFKLELDDLSANADVYILNSNGTVIASSTNAGNRSEELKNLSLLAGTYFIEVRQVSGNTKYELEVEAF